MFSSSLESVAQNLSEGAFSSREGRCLRIASVCTVLPTRARPQHGIFVKRRLHALSQVADVLVLQPMPWFPLIRPAADAAPARDNTVVTTPMFYLPGILKHLDGAWLSRAILPMLHGWHRERRLDLIDAHFGYPEGVGCARAAERLGLPLFITVRGNERLYLQQPRIARQMMSAFNAAAGIIAVSESLKQVLCDQGLEETRVRIIPNAVDHSLFFPGNRTEARRRLKLDPSKLLILVVGHLTHEKGHHLVVRAMAQLKKRVAGLECIIIGGQVPGEKRYARHLRQCLHAHRLETAMHLVGVVAPDDIGEWYRAADLFVLPSYREGCCNAVLEALSCGLPVITTPVGDNAKYVVPGLNGELVAVDNVTALAAAIEKALATDWDRRLIALRAARNDWTGVARQVVEFFEERLGSPMNRTI
jgi:glycosyltransferase involved in cell wall biosynthesis